MASTPLCDTSVLHAIFTYTVFTKSPFTCTVPNPVSNISIMAMQPPINITTISWTPPTAQDTPVSRYIVTYTNTCPSDEHNTQSSGGVTVSSPSTSTTVTLQLGQLYNISVSASNAVGISLLTSCQCHLPDSSKSV